MKKFIHIFALLLSFGSAVCGPVFTKPECEELSPSEIRRQNIKKYRQEYLDAIKTDAAGTPIGNIAPIQLEGAEAYTVEILLPDGKSGNLYCYRFAGHVPGCSIVLENKQIIHLAQSLYEAVKIAYARGVVTN